MPGFDRTGPLGGGPRTGWGRGMCGADANSSRFPQGGLLRGVGRGGFPRGGGRGRCFGGGGWRPGRFTIPVGASSAQDEVEILRNELAAAEQEITAMKSRLEELEKKG